MLRNIIVATWLCITALSANATEYTDAWVPLGEEGSGTLIVQSESFIILGLWVFDQNGKPVWYSCQITLGANGSTFSGGLYASTGTYYALPWNPAAAGITQVGTCTFVPTDAYNATLTYTFTGAQPIVKQIQRFPLTGYNLAGNYSGSMAGSVTGCQDPGGNIPSFRGRYNLVVTQNGDQSAGLTFTFVDNVYGGTVCTVNGPLAHYGRLYQLNGVTNCTGPDIATGNSPATINSLHPTGQGVEGHWTGSVGGGCQASLHFSAVQNVNN